jgi:hypothetical protein
MPGELHCHWHGLGLAHDMPLMADLALELEAPSASGASVSCAAQPVPRPGEFK